MEFSVHLTDLFNLIYNFLFRISKEMTIWNCNKSCGFFNVIYLRKWAYLQHDIDVKWFGLKPVQVPVDNFFQVPVYRVEVRLRRSAEDAGQSADLYHEIIRMNLWLREEKATDVVNKKTIPFYFTWPSLHCGDLLPSRILQVSFRT